MPLRRSPSRPALSSFGRWLGAGLMAAALAAPGYAQDRAGGAKPAAIPLSNAPVADALTPAQATTLSAALAAADRRQWSDALAFAASIGHPTAAKIVTWLALRDSAYQGSFAETAAFLMANPDWPEPTTLRRRAEERLELSGAAPREILDFFAAHPPLTGIGATRYLEALTAAGITDSTRTQISATWQRTDFTDAEEAQFLALFGPLLSSADHAARMERLLGAGKQADARRLLPRLDGSRRALAEARLALMGRTGNADSLVAQLPPALQADPGLLYDRARYLRRSGNETEARSLVMAVRPGTGDDQAWWTERHYHAREALAQGAYREAYQLAASHGLDSGVAFAEGEWLAGWIALRFLNDPGTALRHFTTLHAGVSMPISRSRAAYWAGRAEDAAGRQAEAAKWYAQAAAHGDTYYGQLAAQRLGQNPYRFDPDPKPSAQQRAAFERRELVVAARALQRAGESARARPFVLRLASLVQSPVDYSMTAALALSLGRPDLAIFTAKRAVEDGVMLYEAAYPVVDVSGEATGNRSLVLGLARQESLFNNAAVSPAGAMGIMQLMPDTARRMANAVSVPFDQRRLTYDAAYNVLLGSTYLANMLGRFGQTELALAAYNAGPQRVERWIGQYGDPRGGGVDLIDWIELIPFRETRNYVQRVMEATNVYRHRLGTKVQAIAPAN